MTRIFSGIQPTGRKHLGNYIGAITQYVAGQDRGEAIYCVVDLHATTVAYEPAQLRESVYDTAATLLAAGLDPECCIFFRQGDVAEHSELCWLLSSVTAVGDLNRMHQFKEKSAAQRELVSAGLFFYPVLMAADVLLYRATEVPVGDDQRQHVELMRDVAERFNGRFGEVLAVPEVRVLEVGGRIMDLQSPDRKMSTTGGSPQGTVYVLDDPDVIVRKIRSAVTDSGTEVVSRPGQTGGVEPDRHSGGGAGDPSGGRRARIRLRRVRRLQAGRRRRGCRVPCARFASATRSCERTRPASSERSPRAPTRRGSLHRSRSPTCRRRWGSGRSGPAANFCAVRVADLELDLDVFAGPFDLLLTLILREEVDLLGGRPRGGRHLLHRPPRAPFGARPRGHDRVPGPDRGVARAEVAADVARGGAG